MQHNICYTIRVERNATTIKQVMISISFHLFEFHCGTDTMIVQVL